MALSSKVISNVAIGSALLHLILVLFVVGYGLDAYNSFSIGRIPADDARHFLQDLVDNGDSDDDLRRRFAMAVLINVRINLMAWYAIFFTTLHGIFFLPWRERSTIHLLVFLANTHTLLLHLWHLSGGDEPMVPKDDPYHRLPLPFDTDMEKMLMTNPGLNSRFSERISFPDFSCGSIAELLFLELEKKEIPLEGAAPDDVMKLAQRLIDESGDDFGNGRDVVTWSNRTYKVVAKNFSKKESDHSGLVSMNSSLDDIETALEDYLSARKPRVGGSSCATIANEDALPELGAAMDLKPPPPPLTVEKVYTAEKDASVDESFITSDGGSDSPPSNLFDSMDSKVLETLQTFIDEQGLGSEEGAKSLARLDPNSKEFEDMVARIQERTALSYDEARRQLRQWQTLQEDLEAMIEREKEKKKTLGARPIWRCGVCGRADKPWIACYVAPFIVGYEKIPVGEE
mmetsp:Transcript_9221/g.19742  ORF Transcript_9221/g.19742 Transcript_9221/m.19742 type:complete len:458 (+) Transcript_9221:186-1559(+)